MGAWVMALRIAWRDVRRHKVRSALVLALIALPVLLVSAGAVVVATGDVRGAERISPELGDVAEARIWTEGVEQVLQRPDPNQGVDFIGGGGSATEPPGLAGIEAVLGDDLEAQVLFESDAFILMPDESPRLVEAKEAEWGDPLLAGFVTVVDGALPRTPGEVVVNDVLRDQGFEVGASVTVSGVDDELVVVGVVEDVATVGDPVLYGMPGAVVAADDRVRDQLWSQKWLVDTPVSWEQVLSLNEQGFVVFSRDVLTDPPPDAAVEYEQHYTGGESVEAVTVAVMIVTLVLLEVVLLAGPAFAVTARNHTRTLALVAASGGTPRQARRVILAGGLVLGLVATVVALLLSVPLAVAVMPWAQRLVPERMGPLEVPWLVLLAVAAFGMASALLAAVVPAWLASRQDVVAALAGRRSDGAPKLHVPLLGVVVLGLGVAGTAYGALHSDDLGPVLLSASAVVTMLGMILVVPTVVGAVARLASRLPLPLRYATRDAARHRTRTVPAVAAVAATVAGVVALGIANASDQLENRETYEPAAAIGTGLVTFDTEMWEDDAPLPWDDLEAAAAAAVTDAELHQVRGLPDSFGHVGSDYWSVRGGSGRLDSWGSSFPSSALVADASPETALGAADREAVAEVLASGKVAVLTHHDLRRSVDEVTVVHQVSEGRRVRVVDRVTLPAEVVRIDGSPWSEVLIPTALQDRLPEGAVATVGMTVDSQLDQADEEAMAGALRAVSPRASLYVERGHVRDPAGLILLWVLGVVGGLLMLAGTLTATFLSLADARPDLATVSAVGGSPRTRRSVAASYALMIAAVGAVLGALVGFVPGIAVSRSLTVSHWGPVPTGPFLDVPWLLIGSLVVALPLVSAGVVWLFSRSRLPMVARVD